MGTCCTKKRKNHEESREYLIGEHLDEKCDMSRKCRKSSAVSWLSEWSDIYYTEDSGQSQSQTLNPEKEIIESEKRYFEQLRTLHNEFLVPMFNTGILPREKKRLFTQDLNMIYKLHKTFLTDLRTTDNIPELFIHRADFFKIYINYIENYTLILDSLQEFRNNEKFINFTSELMGKNLYIESLLITPIQRIPRYELLLKEMRKNSNPSKADYDYLIQAQDKVQEVAGKLNERRREFEKLTRLSYIASRIHGQDHPRKLLYHSQRKFLDEQEMKRRSKWDEAKRKPCWTLLFSDLLIITDLSYKIKRVVKLKTVDFIQIVRECNGMICKVENENDLHLFCDDFATAEEWYEKILITRDRMRSRAWSRISRLSNVSRTSSSPLESGKQIDATSGNLIVPKKRSPPISKVSSSKFSRLNVKPEPKNITNFAQDRKLAPLEVSESTYDDTEI